ncbi:DUF6703 family protein [Haloactinopolyspora sp.]|uniref:DUF6703 family protein n=1 Tax=Haloactinopolyspora sp. TaxID=1966353 RepID=UPI0026313972|nr:DUF6703 family protein [Haloactinopolyspora sp.]
MPQNRRQPRRTPNRRPAAPGQGSRAPRPGGSRRPGPPVPPARSSARVRLEGFSYPILVRLSSAPKWLIGIGTGAVLLGGLLAPPPWGPALLGLVVLFLAWLLTLAWPRLDSTARFVRFLVVVALAAVVVARASGWIA